MPTDTERREVARRLRENAEAHPNMSLILNLAFADDSLKPDGAMEWRVTPHDAAMRLSDLIEPSCDRDAERTCRNLNPPSCRDFECSECGESSEFTPGFPPNYCPNCGARVEEASDDADR